MFRRSLYSCLLLLWFLPPLAAQEAANKYAACQDTNNINWYIPERFEEARQAADSQKRILMIKGIAFGIDAVGAKCATKGCW
jgi:hypothetical protein